MHPTPVVAVVAVGFTWILYRLCLHWIYASRYRFPSRVPGLPLIGNTLQFPLLQTEQARWAADLATKYGEMFTVRVGGNDMVFLNSSRVVSDLMDKRAAKYSSRQEFPMVQDLMSGGKRIVLMPYGERWRSIRKIMHGILNSTKMTAFADYQDIETKQLLLDYVRYPELWYRSNQRYMNSVVMSVVFGKRLFLDDPNLEPLLRQAAEMVAHLQPGSTMVDGFPLLAKLPKRLQWWRPKGLRLFEESKRVYAVQVDDLQDRMRKGTAKDCFAVHFLRQTEKSDMDHDQKLFVLGSLLEAGSDTSRMTLSQITAAAVLYPDWVQKARAELDRVCGDAQRLPGWQDRPQLDYITAAVKESFRWRPFAPIGVPHMLSVDDEYEGYKFPAGTLFTWNSLYISQTEHEQAHRFYPERFLNGKLHNVMDGHWAFGPGRRVCVGYNVAETNIWLAIARLIYCFDFEGVPGKPIIPEEIEWSEFEKAPFAVKVSPRSAAHEVLIAGQCNGIDDLQL